MLLEGTQLPDVSNGSQWAFSFTFCKKHIFDGSDIYFPEKEFLGKLCLKSLFSSYRGPLAHQEILV